MKLICPHCNNTIRPEDAARSQTWAETADTASAMGSLWPLAKEYASAFSTKPYRPVAAQKRLRIYKELAQLWAGCEFSYSGKRYRTNKTGILEAVKTVCNMEKSGFTNHNYLKKILLEHADRVSAEGLTAKQEQQIYIDRRRRSASTQKETSKFLDPKWMRQVWEEKLKKQDKK